jgi:hypothetical protein
MDHSHHSLAEDLERMLAYSASSRNLVSMSYSTAQAATAANVSLKKDCGMIVTAYRFVSISVWTTSGFSWVILMAIVVLPTACAAFSGGRFDNR